MNGNPEPPSSLDDVSGLPDEPIPSVPDYPRFFEQTDWLSFLITTALVLMVYLYTLAPEVTLEMSGILSTAAMYGGVAHPPGFPLWTIYAWLFIRLLPFSNIAWRVAVSSAVAGAFACGVIALMVSREGAMLLEGMSGFKRLEPKEERLLRLVCGSVAGMGFGFNGVFWGMAVIVDTLALGNLVFSIVLCLLMRWFYSPNRKRYLYAAFFVYGLAVSAHPALIPAALGLPFFVMLGDRKFGRDLFFAAAILSAAVLVGNWMSSFPIFPDRASPIWAVHFWIGVLSAAICVGLIVKTRSFLTEWRPAIGAGLLSVLGLVAYHYLALASLTDPPSYWGYARTVRC